MKICPACKSQYTDDTLQFCLQDGTRLTFAGQADTPTAVLDKTETGTILRGGPLKSEITPALPIAPHKRVSRTAVAVAVTIVIMLVLFAAGGIGAWLYFKNQRAESSKNIVNSAIPTNVSTRNSAANLMPTEAPKVSSTPTVGGTPEAVIPTPAADDAKIRNEITRKINNWKELTESKNMSGLRSLYAPVLDFYYNKRNVKLESVIDDKENAFIKYDSIHINMSVKSITPENSGEIATAIVEKDWTFDGDDPFCGVVRSELRFRRVNGAWIIIGERDVAGTFRRTC